MTWTPTLQVLSPRAIPTNLLTYAIDAARQADALTWAGGGNLKLIKEYSQSVANRLQPVYPSVAFLQDDDAQDATGDVLTCVYTCTFEFQIQNAVPDTATINARIYEKAFSSMFLNCPDATLLAGTGATTAAVESIERSFEAIRTNDKQNDFMQPFQVRIIWILTAAANG